VNKMSYFSEADIRPLVQAAFKEDIGNADVTSEAIFDGTEKSFARIVAKDSGIMCGGPVLKFIYGELDPSISVNVLVSDGMPVKNGDVIAEIDGRTKTILMGERTALNFIQRMSGIATRTNTLVKILDGTDIKILDTRKTAPGLRLIDKYSVKTGGGENHRIGLFDMVLIKDNHIAAAGSITSAVAKVREKWGSLYKIEVETSTLDEVTEAVGCNPDVIMLDNMDKNTMKEAVRLIDKKAKIELSGNMDEAKLENLKDLDVDYISIGALTHSVKAFDFSMKF